MTNDQLENYQQFLLVIGHSDLVIALVIRSWSFWTDHFPLPKNFLIES